MNSIAGGLHAKIAAVAPIVGVSVGRADDKSTWRVDFPPEATRAQRTAAASVITVFDAAAEMAKAEAGIVVRAARAIINVFISPTAPAAVVTINEDGTVALSENSATVA